MATTTIQQPNSPNNKIILILIGVIVITALLFKINGCYNHNQGVKDEKENSAIKTISNKVKNDFDSISFYKRKMIDLNDSILKVNTKYDKLLSVQSAFQNKANSDKKKYINEINLLSDSLKKNKALILANENPTQVLIRFNNYPIIEAQLDTCESTNTILENKLKGSELLLNTCIAEGKIKDTTIVDLQHKSKLIEKQTNRKFRKKNFLIFTGWATAIGQTALFVWYKVKASTIR